MTDRFEEAQMIASLRSQLDRVQKMVKQLQEENDELRQQNYLLLKKLPDLVAEVKSALVSSRTPSRSPFRPIQVDAAQGKNSPSRTSTQGQPSSPVQPSPNLFLKLKIHHKMDCPQLQN
ncbi:hypothetical protein HOLleu_07801 [Holothuria leucospilota]|uniref:Uncharacterized protein n=1 Tax=Holothuria leucospilota TaxID=206669 RepID=A0A9Q1CGI9_HOLLE|nr:hypothetical protein HOLleu_07801 [Holothuria leucospilota]